MGALLTRRGIMLSENIGWKVGWMTAFALFGALALSSEVAHAGDNSPNSTQLFEKGGASQEMFSNFTVGGGRRRPSQAVPGARDSFAAIPSGIGGTQAPKRAGSQIILPSFPNASSSAVITRPSAADTQSASAPSSQPQRASQQQQAPQAGNGAAAQSGGPVSSEAAAAAIATSIGQATGQVGANRTGDVPSIEYYRQVIAQVQGKSLIDEKQKKTNTVTKAKGLGKANKF